ncbi:hypothetical protein AAFF_G00020870 [Aldrovandia affinis]|uniref:Tudor domain-containing protein n=1 Tax=Aldrovandia affinis TaxID=143900 RepID=A0AAD7S595_9TELE|nr:hypothetical protein AAFF_G00020870 [Aldrovandia affinis]
MFVSYSETSQIWLVEIMINGMFLRKFKATSCLKSGEEDDLSFTNPSTQVMDKPPADKMSCAHRLTLAPVQMDLGHAGFAAAVTAPCEFYIVLEDMLLVMSTVSTILETLPEDLDALPEALLNPGACCLVKLEIKKKWCRAEIVHVDGISVVINLVDYGHCTNIPYTCCGQLKRLPEELARLPKVTYPCVLRGIKPAGVELWTDKAVVFFQECICQKSLLIYFRQYVSEAQWEVDIVSGGINVAKELVDAGHATYIDSMLGLRLQQGLHPIGASQPEFIPSLFGNTFKIKPESKPAETKDMCLLKPLGFCNNMHRQEHVKEEDHGAIDDAKNQSFDEGTIQDSGRKRGSEVSDNKQCNIQETGSKELTKAVPGAGTCTQM